MIEVVYSVPTISDCFELYHEQKMACQCDGDNKKVIIEEE